MTPDSIGDLFTPVVSAMTLQVIALLVLVNAFYVCAEFGFVAVRQNQVRLLADEGNTLARWVMEMISHPAELDRAISTCQIGITLSSLILGAYGQAKLTPGLAVYVGKWLGLDTITALSLTSVSVLIILTALQVVFGELVPKFVALQYPLKSALYTVLPLRWSRTLFALPMVVLNGTALLILRAMRVVPARVRHVHSAKEIELLIAETRREGLIEPEEHVRFRRALRLGMRSTRTVMVPIEEVVSVDVNAPIDEALSIAARSPYTRLPVYEGTKDKFVGLLHVKDLVIHHLEHGEVPSIRPVLRPIVHVSERTEADELLALLRERRTQLAVVFDEKRKPIGVVTLEDVLAEVLGDVGDEFKGSTEMAPERTADGRVRLPASYPLEEAETWIGARWRGDAKTVGAFITNHLKGARPTPGAKLEIDGIAVEIERVTRHRIVSILATPVMEAANG